MRAVVLALVCVATATAALAQDAAPKPVCSAERKLVLTAQPDELPLPDAKIARPDLVGKVFRIQSIRYSKTSHDYIVTMETGKEKFLVVDNVTPRSTPGSFFTSFKPGDEGVSPRLLLDHSKTKAGGDWPWDSLGYAKQIHGGPLAGLEFKVTGCDP